MYCAISAAMSRKYLVSSTCNLDSLLSSLACVFGSLVYSPDQSSLARIRAVSCIASDSISRIIWIGYELIQLVDGIPCRRQLLFFQLGFRIFFGISAGFLLLV